jgi:hypothetical protein
MFCLLFDTKVEIDTLMALYLSEHLLQESHKSKDGTQSLIILGFHRT